MARDAREPASPVAAIAPRICVAMAILVLSRQVRAVAHRAADRLRLPRGDHGGVASMRCRHGEAAHVVGEVLQPDFRLRPREANRANDLPPIALVWWPNTCSTVGRTRDRAVLSRCSRCDDLVPCLAAGIAVARVSRSAKPECDRRRPSVGRHDSQRISLASRTGGSILLSRLSQRVFRSKIHLPHRSAGSSATDTFNPICTASGNGIFRGAL